MTTACPSVEGYCSRRCEHPPANEQPHAYEQLLLYLRHRPGRYHPPAHTPTHPAYEPGSGPRPSPRHHTFLPRRQLYDVLTHPAVIGRRLPIFLACNKSDMGVKAHSVDFIRKRLEKELDLVSGTLNQTS